MAGGSSAAGGTMRMLSMTGTGGGGAGRLGNGGVTRFGMLVSGISAGRTCSSSSEISENSENSCRASGSSGSSGSSETE